MTAAESTILNARIAELLHMFFVNIRFWSYAGTGPDADGNENRFEEINDLADLAHNLPRSLVGHDTFGPQTADELRAVLVEHVRRFYPEIDPNQHCYIRLMDMDEREFLSRYRDNIGAEPVAAAN